MAQEANENEVSVKPYWRNCDTEGDSEIFKQLFHGAYN